MSLFQKSVITKYLKSQNKEHVNSKWNSYSNHFLSPKVQEDIRNLKEEQYQGEFLEDLFVDEALRGQGVGTELLNMVIAEAKNLGCYKLVATSRHEREGVHKMYEKNGFKNFGIEFKKYLKK